MKILTSGLTMRVNGKLTASGDVIDGQTELNKSPNSDPSLTLGKRIALLGTTLMSLCFFSLPSLAEEALCAEVKIQILQELTLERQGFEAMMRITNSLDSLSLENVSVSVNFADENDNPVVATSNTAASDAAFFIRIDDTRDITGLQEGADGFVEQGVIAPTQVGEIRWLIIPTANAAAQRKDGKLYFVGAQLSYTYGGKEELVNVAPDSIVVKPQPALTLDYFLTQHIVGDDAFTQEIEHPEPYTLGVRISNTGFGDANAVKIESAQPTIEENELGLAIDFKILSSFVADQPVEPTLLINFGTIAPQAVSVGRWLMETSLAGKFTSFTASFTHADELGGELTSLLQGTNAHFLVRDVVVDVPGRDVIRDFLAYNPQQELYVYESENTGLNHAFCNHCVEVDVVTATLNGQQLTHSPAAGFSFAKVADPYNGTKVLSRIVRSDGKVLHPQNAWLGKERAANNISFNYFVYAFDTHSTGEYTVHWGGNLADQPQPPVIEYLTDRHTFEGGSVGFLVQASDPNNTLPTLTVQQLPTGATFVNQATNNGVFQWQPAIGQAGNYTLTFTANDGTFTTERTMTIRVNPAYDIDGDGMDDAWELEHFGNLDNDGTTDSDGDGRSDLQEFEEGTDPTVAEVVPGTPQIAAPIFDADTLVGATAPYFPTLTVTNGMHGTGIEDVSIVFEVYADEGLTQLLATATVGEGSDTTTSVVLSALHMQEEAVFDDNQLYYWRARARDNTNTALTSAWVKSRFYINSANDAPTVAGISSPTDNSIVSSVSPELIVTNASDIDRDRLYYGFVIYDEADLAAPLAEVTSLYPGNNGQTGWRVPRILGEDKRYVWQSTVTDEHGLATSTEWSSFLVSTLNHAPTLPGIAFPELLSVVSELEADNSLTLRVDNAADPERGSLTYVFELDTLNTFDSQDKQVSEAIAEGATQTSWLATDLLENTTYFWRVRASDGTLFGPWAAGEFSVSSDNEAPSVPVLQNPVNGSVVTALRPLLEINPSVDPEGTALSYEFELYPNEALTGLIAENETTNIYWTLDFDLSNTSTYYWRARAKDAGGVVSAWSSTGHFTVNVAPVNEPPQMSFVLPATNTTVEDNQVLLQWVDSDSDSSASISLFRHRPGSAPVLIASGLSEDADGEGDQYLWDTTGLSSGDYTVSAVISDEESEVTVDLCCVITVDAEVEPSPVLVLDESTVSFVGAHVVENAIITGWTGSGFIDYIGEGRAVWAVNVPEEGVYSVQVRYALQSNNRRLKMVVNDTTGATLHFPPTGSFSSWSTVTSTVILPAGNITFALATTGSSGANVDKVELQKIDPPNLTVLDEENVIFQGSHEVATNVANYTGSGFIDVVGEGQVHWPVNVDVATTFNVSIRYSLLQGTRPMQLLLNGVEIAYAGFPSTGSFATWEFFDTSISVPAGNNILSLQTLGSSGPNIDQIDLVATSIVPVEP